MGTKITLEFSGVCVPNSLLYVSKSNAVDYGEWAFLRTNVVCFDGTSGLHVSSLSETNDSNSVTTEQAAILISAVLAVWAIAWVFRRVIDQIRNRN